MMVASAIVLAGMITGCATVDPLKVEQTVRDLGEYKADVVRPVPAARYKIAVRSAAVKHASDPRNDEFMAAKVYDGVVNNFSNLGWFETVDRKHGFAIAEEGFVAGRGDAGTPVGAQFLLTADSSVLYIAKQGWKRTAYSDKSRGAVVDTQFSMIDLATKETIVSKKFRSAVTSGKGGVKEAIAAAANINTKKFARVIAARFLPEVKVLQTRGDGKYAQVAMGKNYQATPELRNGVGLPAARVEFLTLEKGEGEGKYNQNIFARGTVIRSEGDKKSWVEIDNYKNAGVHKGHLVKIAEDMDDDGQGLE